MSFKLNFASEESSHYNHEPNKALTCDLKLFDDVLHKLLFENNREGLKRLSYL